MASEVVVLISSSPPRPAMSQNRSLYSPSRRQTSEKPSFKPGSRAAPIPEGAVVGFQSASRFAKFAATITEEVDAGHVQAKPFGGKDSVVLKENAGPNESITKADPIQDETSIKAKKRVRKATEDGEAIPKKRPAVKKAKKQEDMSTADIELQPGFPDHKVHGASAEPAQPARSKDRKDATEVSTTMKLSRPQEEAPKPALKVFRMPKPLTPVGSQRQPQLLPHNATVPDSADNGTAAATLDREQHQSRRRSCTPPDNDPLLLTTNSSPDVLVPREALGYLQDRFGHREDSAERQSTVGEPTEPKLPRLDGLPEETFKKPAAPIKPTKQRSPPKKALTITGLSIAQLQRVIEKSNTDHAPDIEKAKELQALSFLHVEPASEPNPDDNEEKKPRKRKRAAKPEPPKAKQLPSPLSAIKRFERQDYVFGTSSQIRHEDTQYLLDVEEAIKASAAESQGDGDMTPKMPGHALKASSGRLLRASPSLWTVSARVDDRSDPLLAPESTQERRQYRSPERARRASISNTKPIVTNTAEPDYFDIDTVAEDHKTQSVAPVPRPIIGLKLSTSKLKSSLKSQSGLLLSSNSDVLRPISPNRPSAIRSYGTANPKEKSKKQEKQKEDEPIAQAEATDKPLTIVKASAKSSAKASANNPAPKKRKTKSDKDAQPNPTAENPTSDKPPAPKRQRKKKEPIATVDTDPAAKRPRGRPRKDHTALDAQSTSPSKAKKAKDNATADPADYHHIDDIEDDVAPSPSPPRRTTTSLPAQLELSQPTAETIEAIEEESLFSSITATIKNAPRSTDLKNPSWFEKILLYDPIVLEDLTDWLREQGVRMGDGKDIRDSIVQKWCERKSICCLWREGLRGGVRKRY